MKYLYLLFALTIVSCQKQPEKKVPTIDYINPVLIEDDLKNWLSISSAKRLEISDSLIFGAIKQIELNESSVFFLEEGVNLSILIFDLLGNFQSQLSKLGTGPGEYTQLDFFFLSTSKLFIYDRSQNKIVSYALDDFSDFEEFKLDDYYVGGVGQLESDKIFLISDSDLEERIQKGYVFSNSEFSNIRYNPQPSGYTEGFLPQSISQTDDTTFVIQPFSDKIFLVQGDSLFLKKEINFGSMKIPSEARSFYEAEEFWEILDGGNYYFAATNLLTKNDMVSFNFYNRTIDNLNMALIEKGQSYRFSIDSRLAEIFLKPICVRDGDYQTVLLPGEYDEELIEVLNLTDVNYEKPIWVSYSIGK